MLKKTGFLYLGVVLAIGGYWYWSGTHKEIQKIPEPHVDLVKKKEPAVKTQEEVEEDPVEEEVTQNALPEEVPNDDEYPEDIPEEYPEEVPPDNDEVLNGESVTPLEEYVEEDISYMWSQKARNLFVDELGFAEKDYEDYLNLRDRFETERMQVFSDFYEEMANKYGDSYSFEPSQEMKDVESRIKQDYLDQLRGRLGEEGFSRYQQALKEFNDTTARRMEGSESIPYIEF